jgi:hypothetical protein
MIETSNIILRPNSTSSSTTSSQQLKTTIPLKKKSLFFFNLKLDALSSSKQQQKQQQQQPSSYLQLFKTHSISIKNHLISQKNHENFDSSSPLKQSRHVVNKVSTPSATSKDSFSFFEDIQNKTERSHPNSPFLLRKTRSQVYTYNPFISTNGDLDQISRISSSTSTNTIRTDSGLSSVDSTQLLCSELKDCLEKGESYNNIEIKFRKNLYAFWSLDELGNSIFHLAAKYGCLDVLR